MASPDETTIKDLSDQLEQFCKERQWDRFHTPQNLAVSVAVEAGELLEHFQWPDPEATSEHVAEHFTGIKEEVADVGIYLFELARVLGIDLGQVMSDKIEQNRTRYPLDARNTKDGLPIHER
jgi:NTP pyrophosphatase (non-canonical NTP hydrolase)